MAFSEDIRSPRQALRRLLVLLEALDLTMARADSIEVGSSPDPSTARALEREVIGFAEARGLLTPAGSDLLRSVETTLAAQPRVARELYELIIGEIAALRHDPEYLEAIVAAQRSIIRPA